MMLCVTEPCGCKWDDCGSPINMCELHCPPSTSGIPTDEYLAVVKAEKGVLSDEYYE